MAVDEWLLTHAGAPVLRVYRWDGAWASVGYFGSHAAAQDAFPGTSVVRRWTGGGTVDHRADWTYSLVIPRPHPLATVGGAESYRLVHAAVAEMLASCGTTARMSAGGDATGAPLCFENPVCHDLLGEDGRKLAGAGQRRTRHGLLHQGSVAGACSEEISRQRSEALADLLADSWSPFPLACDAGKIADITASRYARASWTQRR